MATYHHRCKECSYIQEEHYSMNDPAWDIKIFDCDLCGGPSERTMHKMIPRFIKKGKGWPDKERKLDEHMKWVERVQNEPATRSEVLEGMDMLREREKEKGYPEGYLTGERPKEKILVNADTGEVIDKNKLAASANKKLKEAALRDPNFRTKGANIHLTAKDLKLREGDKPIKKVVEVERTKVQSREKLAERAKEQSRMRARNTGS